MLCKFVLFVNGPTAYKLAYKQLASFDNSVVRYIDNAI